MTAERVIDEAFALNVTLRAIIGIEGLLFEVATFVCVKDAHLTGPAERRIGRRRFDICATSSYWYPVDYWQQLGENYSTGDERWFTIGFEGGRWFREWFYLGGSLIWSGGFIPVRYTPTHQRVSTFTSTNISIMPIVRFAWLRRGIVQLYSGVGLGFAVGYNEKIDYNDTLVDVAYDVTFIGLSIGRDIFGYIDIGVGNRGVISAGIGYRFNN